MPYDEGVGDDTPIAGSVQRLDEQAKARTDPPQNSNFH